MHSSSLYISAEHINDFLTKLSQLTYFILFLYLRFQKRQPYIYHHVRYCVDCPELPVLTFV